ncbi:ATP-binding protein [Ralstonia solanacearum species complex bacterium KE056]|uniref:ATP-binding protein n=1 Tax=Ralstonia solanacearum species complex bacterium KE056 TaxID=3119585 RepID=UPI002FC28B44
MKINNHVRNAIENIRLGTIGAELESVFFPNNEPVPKECVLWDYKESVAEDRLAYAELAKDILSFFNSYGGYLFIGVAEKARDENFSVVGFQRSSDFFVSLRAALDSYSSLKIEVSVSDLNVSGKAVVAIFIPCRPISQPPAFLTKNGPEKKPGRPIFQERTTYFRQHDSTLAATIASQWEFLNSARNHDELLAGGIPLSPVAALSRVVPNNLPDRSLICSHLFGREEILASLWAWIADELEPVRLLAGAGGRGKSSIAYEFASRFFRNAPMPFVQVLWVSAKRFQFRADRNEYMELPECWYSDPRELLEVLCIGTAALTQIDLTSEDESEYTLQKKLRESLRLLPSLIVVDDIDSLQQAQQKRVFELVQQVSAGALSKFLLTTRANFAFSDTQCIQVSGLDGAPYQSFVSDRLERFGLSPLKPVNVRDLQVSSGGSPLWTDSILRLMKQGYQFPQALKEWVGKPGEDARAAALRKELEALSVGAKRILYAASVLQDCSRTELLEITKVGKIEFDESITELQTLFLVDAPKIIENEPRFSVAESTAIAVRESADDLVADHKRLLWAAREFTKKVAAASGTNARKKIGFVVKQAIALISANRNDDAIKTVEAALKAMPDHPDLLMLKGRCLREASPSEAVIALNAAFKRGQRKPLLFDMWYQALSSQGQFAAAVDVANLAIDGGLNRSTWLPLRAHALVQIGLVRHRDGSAEAAVDMLQKAAVDLSAAITANSSSAKQANEHRSDFLSVNDAAWTIATRGSGLGSDLLAFDVAKNALEQGDHRAENVERLMSATSKLIAGVDLATNSVQARAGRTRISDALDALRRARHHPDLPSVAHGAYDVAIKDLEHR